jgi:hypothetical protein
MMEARFGKMPTTSVRRLISLLSLWVPETLSPVVAWDVHELGYLSMSKSSLLIRGFGVQVPGGAPVREQAL